MPKKKRFTIVGTFSTWDSNFFDRTKVQILDVQSSFLRHFSGGMTWSSRGISSVPLAEILFKLSQDWSREENSDENSLYYDDDSKASWIMIPLSCLKVVFTGTGGPPSRFAPVGSQLDIQNIIMQEIDVFGFTYHICLILVEKIM